MGKQFEEAEDKTVCYRAVRNSYRGIDPMVIRIARSVANKAIGKAGLTESDLPDLEQELMLAGLKALQYHDPAKGDGAALVKTVVTNRLKAIFKYRLMSKRDYRCCQCSLDQEIEGEDGEDTVALVEYLSASGSFGPPTSDELNAYNPIIRRLDINTAIAHLPSPLRRLCEELKIMTVNEVAEIRNIPPQALNRHMKKIRKFFLCYLSAEELNLKRCQDYRPSGW